GADARDRVAAARRAVGGAAALPLVADRARGRRPGALALHGEGAVVGRAWGGGRAGRAGEAGGGDRARDVRVLRVVAVAGQLAGLDQAHVLAEVGGARRVVVEVGADARDRVAAARRAVGGAAALPLVADRARGRRPGALALHGEGA